MDGCLFSAVEPALYRGSLPLLMFEFVFRLF